MRLRNLGIAIAFVLLATGGYLVYKIFAPAIHNKQNAYFYIEQGESLSGLKEQLIKQQFLKKGDGFDMAASILRFQKPKPGRYLLKDGLSAWKLVRLLRSGEQALVKVTIVKERTKELFCSKIGKGKKFDFQFDSLQMIQFLNNPDSVAKFGVDTQNVMSIIIPDTYFHKWNSSPGKLMAQLHSGFKKFWNEKRISQASSHGLTPMQVMILASIVEEETTLKEDKYKIASVYLNRLKKGMKLQADPTVKFITRNFQLGRITYAHLKLESPYNTYLHAGLPPGPICTPSVESIEAVLNAPATPYLFFVASHTFDGSSIFTTNLADHNKYARLYQRELNRRADSVRKLKQKQKTVDKKNNP